MNKLKINNKANATITIYEAITYKYAELMKIAEREYYHIHSKKEKSGEDSFKDIAHDTLLKMCNIFDNAKTTLKHIKAYFCKAVRMNYIKELISLKPEYVDVLPDAKFLAETNSPTYAIDYNIILSDVESNFDKNDCDIYVKFCQGYKLRELDDEYHIHNSAYIIRKIKSFIKESYPGYKLKRGKNTHNN